MAEPAGRIVGYGATVEPILSRGRIAAAVAILADIAGVIGLAAAVYLLLRAES